MVLICLGAQSCNKNIVVEVAMLGLLVCKIMSIFEFVYMRL